MRDAVLAWYRTSGRVLPFRATRDPYAILVSEVMAQQTQIARVAEAWTRFIARFPTFGALAAASPADVLREWRGMGYNRRALNLLRAARIVVAEHDGELPRDLHALEQLPGIGPYTARAVAALAFGEPVGAVDTNVRRVLGRVSAGRDHASLGTHELQVLADAAIPHHAAGEWTHAMMDVGATFCRPRDPLCVSCPAARWCRFATSGSGERPGERPAEGARLAARRRSTPAFAARRRSTPPFAARRRSTPPFAATRRWLRGRVMDRLRDADGDSWITFGEAVGEHDLPSVHEALAALAAEGLVELEASSAPSAPHARLARA